MSGLQSGRKFLTERDEVAVRYEIGIALEGQTKIRDAIAEFDFVRDWSASDSYYAMASSYEVARLNLALWLDAPTNENFSHLDYAVDHLRDWLARDWNKLTTKMWGYYHGACAYRQKMKYLGLQGRELSREESDQLVAYTDNFRAIARSQKGVRRYELRFSAFFLMGKSYERFPGEPLRCDLNDLLAEFQIF